MTRRKNSVVEMKSPDPGLFWLQARPTASFIDARLKQCPYFNSDGLKHTIFGSVCKLFYFSIFSAYVHIAPNSSIFINFPNGLTYCHGSECGLINLLAYRVLFGIIRSNTINISFIFINILTLLMYYF